MSQLENYTFRSAESMGSFPEAASNKRIVDLAELVGKQLRPSLEHHEVRVQTLKALSIASLLSFCILCYTIDGNHL